MAVASSGIASILLENGTTAHSRFRIPLVVDSTTSIGVSLYGNKKALAQLLLAADVFVWDEIGMMSVDQVNCVDRMLREVTGRPKSLFGGKAFLFGGDFRQLLPIVKGVGRAGLVAKTMPKISWWKDVTKLNLIENMRLSSDTDVGDFTSFLKQIGDGTAPIAPGLGVRILDDCVFELGKESPQKDKLLRFVRWCFPIGENPDPTAAILSPYNEHVNEINELALNDMPGETQILHSLDSVSDDTCTPRISTAYPQSFLNGLDFPGLPPHQLKLKQGCPVILLRNLNPKKGLCNGTKLRVDRIGERLLHLTIVSGKYDGTCVVLPRIDLIENDNNSIPFNLRRRQFPLRLAFALSINKSQGQSLSSVGIYLPKPCFAHGQLFVGLSRAQHSKRIKVLVDKIVGQQGEEKDVNGVLGCYTSNIVYTEIFDCL